MYLTEKKTGHIRDWLILRPSHAKPISRNVTLEQLKQEVAAQFEITVAAMEGRRRKFSPARAEFCRRAAHMQIFTIAEIGRALGFDHTTVMYHLRKFKDEQF